MNRISRWWQTITKSQEVTALTLTPVQSIGPSEGGRISVEGKPEDGPEWRRVYRAKLPGGFRVEIELRSYYFSDTRRDSSYLYQRNGKMISFDATAVADKIIDRELYPLVQAVTDEILMMDAAFMRSRPNQFIDKRGSVWRRIA